MVKLKLSHGRLQNLETNALSQFGSKIQELDLAHNQLSQIPNGFLAELTSLEILNLASNFFVELDLTALMFVKRLTIDNSPFLQTLSLNSNESYIDSNLEFVSARNNPVLTEFCPWIIWTSYALTHLDLSTCPQLKLPHRVFKANDALDFVQLDQVVCDCSPPIGKWSGYKSETFHIFLIMTPFYPLLDKFQDCLNMELGKKQKVEIFRLKNCAVNPEKNQSAISAIVSNPLRLDCEILESDKFNHVMWITPLGTIKVCSSAPNLKRKKA